MKKFLALLCILILTLGVEAQRITPRLRVTNEFSIKPKTSAPTGTLGNGYFYIDNNGILHIHNGTNWRDFVRDSTTVARTNRPVTFQQNATFSGDVTVSGNFIRQNVTDIDVSDNVVLLNSGESGSGVTSRFAGVQIDRGTLIDEGLVFDENDDTWKIGDFESLNGMTVSSTNNTIVLPSTASTVNGAYHGMPIRVFKAGETSQVRTIINYLGFSRTATVDANWTTNPDNTWNFRLLTNQNLNPIYHPGNSNLTTVDWSARDLTALGEITSTASGVNNERFGRRSLSSNTTGDFISCFGINTLRNNTTGEYNSAFGYDALNSNTTGDDNSVFGYDALSSNTTGDDNSAFGSDVLDSNTTGRSNSAFGSSAFGTLTSGDLNCSFGFNSGRTVFSHVMNRCTFLGASTRSAATQIIENSTAIGYESTITKSNQIVLGNTSVQETLLNGHNLMIGNGSSTNNKSIIANNIDSNKPEIRYNETSDRWQVSNNGTTFTNIGSGDTYTATVTLSGWNMDADASVTVGLPTGVTVNMIKGITFNIRNDDNNIVVDFDAINVSISGSMITVSRRDGSTYDSIDFNNTIGLRGHIVLQVQN